MDNEKTGGPAYPETKNNGFGYEYTVAGNLTVLDHFAGLAMQGIVSGVAGLTGEQEEWVRKQWLKNHPGKTWGEAAVSQAYSIAAAMIAERNRLMNENR